MNLQPKNGKKYHIFGKKRNKKFIFPHFRVTLPYFPKKVLFLTFFGVAPDFGSQPDFKIKSEFSRKLSCKKGILLQYFNKKWLQNGKTGGGSSPSYLRNTLTTGQDLSNWISLGLLDTDPAVPIVWPARDSNPRPLVPSLSWRRRYHWAIAPLCIKERKKLLFIIIINFVKVKNIKYTSNFYALLYQMQSYWPHFKKREEFFPLS